ncbi:unnamed protein product, partial [marine sediment metagenome]
MKLKSFHWMVLPCVAAWAFVATASANVLTNPGFESGNLSGWLNSG